MSTCVSRFNSDLSFCGDGTMMYLEDLVARNIDELKNERPDVRKKARKSLLAKARTQIHESHWVVFKKTTVGPYVNKAITAIRRSQTLTLTLTLT